jgi:hypothetical protein
MVKKPSLIQGLRGARDDVLEVRLSDSGYKVYFKEKVNLNNDKALNKLFFNDLCHFGLDMERVKKADKKKSNGRWW